MGRGRDFDREIGGELSCSEVEIGTLMVIIFSLLLAFFFFTDEVNEFSISGRSLG